MTEFTQWFPATIKPVHVGYYDTRTEWAGEMVLYWCGSSWRASATSPPDKWANPKFGSAREWRGLTTPPVVAA